VPAAIYIIFQHLVASVVKARFAEKPAPVVPIKKANPITVWDAVADATTQRVLHQRRA